MTPNDDELQARLRASDPMPDRVPTEPASGRAARELLEQIMQTDVSSRSTESAPAGAPWWRRPIPAVAAIAVVAALGVGAVIAATGDDPAGTPGDDPSVLALDGAGAQDPMAMCLQVTPENLAMFPVAFAGRAIAVEDGVATLEVTRWYRGGEAEQVTITAPPAQPALVGGVDIEVGGDYLITAEEGTVSSCHFSDAATPGLEALYAEAFDG